MRLFRRSKANPADGQVNDDPFFVNLRRTEYRRLDETGNIYLDYTGGNLYPESLILAYQELLLNNVLGNPHSSNPTSRLSTELVEAARKRVIDFFNAGDYICIFTQNASGALKIVGESYPFDDATTLLMLADNHNSVNGIREFCISKGGKSTYVPVQYEDLRINEETLDAALRSLQPGKKGLFAMPGQSNVSGVKHDLSWIAKAKELGWDVLLDAAALVPTTRLDLSAVKPDFVSVSFYKIFGYPTGIGCLLMHKDVFSKMVKPWFAGGTVNYVTIAMQQKDLMEGHERFEDGTLNYAGIPAIKIGLDYISDIGMDKVNQRVMHLTHYLLKGLLELKHSNGKPVVRIFGPTDIHSRGGNILLNIFDPEGNKTHYTDVESEANKRMFSIRSGCMCNPGIDEINNCITTDELSQFFMSRDNRSDSEKSSFLGKMRGAVRISVGISTSLSDLDKFVQFIASYAK
jgi:molybdenum cofactor sulfurtransferase